MAEAWRNRIVGNGVEVPEQLLANPANWRIHPKHQQDALEAVLNEVGWVQNAIVNQRTGHVVDGHLRVSLALRREEKEIPVVYIDVSENEEALILATIDPLSALASTDKQKLDELLREVQTSEPELQKLLASMMPFATESADDQTSQLEPKFDVLVECDSEAQQRTLLERLSKESFRCRALIA